MRRLVTWLCIAGPMAAPPAASGQTPAVGETLAALMAGADVPGLSVAVVSAGRVAWDTTVGVTDVRSGRPVTRNTVFEAASLTKPVVAYLALRYVERGELDLDMPLWDLLPYPRLEHDERARRITARHVLSHTTGLPNWGGTPLEMRRPPGERWGYSGEGFVYLQRVLESIAGEPLAVLAQREVFDPLGMTSSSLVWRADYDDVAATGHDLIAEPAAKGRPEEANGAASLHTTAVDYARFLGAVLEARGLEPRTVVEMLTPASQVQGGGPDEHAANLQWGLGWGVQNGDRRNAIWHWGDNGVFRCFVIAYPSQRSGLVYLTNSENGLAIAEDLVSLFYRDSHHSIRWLDDWRWDDPRRRTRVALRRAFVAGADTGLARLAELRARTPETVTSAELADLTSFLRRRGAGPEAVAAAEARVEMDPGAAARVGLAQALTTAGRWEAALEAYEVAAEMNPGRAGAVSSQMEWLRAGIAAQRHPVSLSATDLERYVGSYGPRRIRLVDGVLVYSREGMTDPTPLAPLTREVFAVPSNGAFRLRFVLDESGTPIGLVGSYPDGREDETPRTSRGPQSSEPGRAPRPPFSPPRRANRA